MAIGRKYFGTDGVRGRVGESPITPDFVMKLGWAAGRVFGRNDGAGVLIGKDTRISGYMFESALEAGISASGVDVRLLGPMPTPAIAYLTRTFRAHAGIVISASHNPYYDNGIKFFAGNGLKLADSIEAEIEAELDAPLVTVDSGQLGKAHRIDDAAGRYIEFCKSTFPCTGSLDGLRVVVDCANGATYHVAPRVFAELGADLIAVGVEPDGLNINDGCGAIDPSALAAKVLEHDADVGIALDGDGDRLIMVDHTGYVTDGDELLYVIAKERMRAGKPLGPTVVGTQMSNLGLEQAIRTMGLGFERTKVGDRYILERLIKEGWLLGGETSGHLICADLLTTGDGTIGALQVLGAMVSTGVPLSELRLGMTKFPQVLVNVKLDKRVENPVEKPGVQAAVAATERELGSSGRVLLRPSGTEPVIRVMVEGEDEAQVARLANQLAAVVSDQLQTAA